MSIDMDVVGVTAAYLPVVRVCSAQSRGCLHIQLTIHTRHGQICCRNTEYVRIKGHRHHVPWYGRNFTEALYRAPWFWIPCDPKHVGAILNILNVL